MVELFGRLGYNAEGQEFETRLGSTATGKLSQSTKQ